MEFVKKHILKISLFLLLLAAGYLCNSILTQSQIEPGDSPSGERSRQADTPQRIAGDGKEASELSEQMPREQFPDADSTQRTAPNRSTRGEVSGEGTEYAPQIAVYSIVFFILSIAAYYRYLYKYKNVKIHPSNAKIIVFTLLCVGLLLRIACSNLIEGHPFDISLFKTWATTAADNLFQVYSGRGSSDYPPLYIYVLSFIGKIARLPAMNPYFNLLLKLPSILADIAASFLIYKLADRYLSQVISILLSAFYIFNPAVLINSTLWGQVDSFFTLIVICALLMLTENKIGLASALFTAAVLMKPQGIIFLPVLFFALIREKNYKGYLQAAVFALGTAAIIVLPFTLNYGGSWIFKLFSNTMAQYHYASVNAFNFFSLLGANYIEDATTLFIFSYYDWGMIFIVLCAAWSWFIYIKGNARTFAFAAALLLIAGVFTFSARMHERYLFPAVALSIFAFIYLKDKRLLLSAAGFSSTAYINAHLVLFETGRGIDSQPFSPVMICVSLLNVLLFVHLAKVLFDIAVKKRSYPCRC